MVLPLTDDSVPFIVIAALAVIVPLLLIMLRLLNVVAIDGIVCVPLPLSATVPLLCVNVPALCTKLPATCNVVEGAVTVPVVMVKFPPTSAAFAPKLQDPAELLKVKL